MECYLNRQIDWKITLQEKEISVNLAKRMRKIEEQAYVDELNSLYDSLKNDNYRLLKSYSALPKSRKLNPKNLAKPVETGEYEKKKHTYSRADTYRKFEGQEVEVPIAL